MVKNGRRNLVLEVGKYRNRVEDRVMVGTSKRYRIFSYRVRLWGVFFF